MVRRRPNKAEHSRAQRTSSDWPVTGQSASTSTDGSPISWWAIYIYHYFSLQMIISRLIQRIRWWVHLRWWEISQLSPWSLGTLTYIFIFFLLSKVADKPIYRVFIYFHIECSTFFHKISTGRNRLFPRRSLQLKMCLQTFILNHYLTILPF
jgi:hypothetical protein